MSHDEIALSRNPDPRELLGQTPAFAAWASARGLSCLEADAATGSVLAVVTDHKQAMIPFPATSGIDLFLSETHPYEAGSIRSFPRFCVVENVLNLENRGTV